MVFANMLLVFMMSLQLGMYGLMVDNSLKLFTGHIQVQAPGFKDDQKMRQTVPDILPLAQSYREQLAQVQVAARGSTFEPQVSSIPGLVDEGRYLSSNDATEIVIGRVLARNLRVGIGDELTLLGSGLDGSFAASVVEVVGIFDSGVKDIDRNIAQIPIGLFQETFFMEGAGHQVVIVADDRDMLPVLIPEVAGLLPPNSGLVVLDWDQLQPGLKQAITADMASSFFMYFILVILVSFSVLNTQLMSVLERTREFGIVMALGLRPGKLGRLVLLETAMMGSMGLLLGALAGGLLTAWFSGNGIVFPGMDEMAAQFNLPARMYPKVSLLTLFGGPAIVFAFTLLAAVYPAVRLNWQNPVDSMRVA